MFNCGTAGSTSLNDLPSYSLHVWSYTENNISPKALSSPFVGCAFLETWFADVFSVSAKWPFFFLDVIIPWGERGLIVPYYYDQDCSPSSIPRIQNWSV